MSNKHIFQSVVRSLIDATRKLIRLALLVILATMSLPVVLLLWDDYQAHNGFGPAGEKFLLRAVVSFALTITLIVILAPRKRKE
jgi:hypothetical protein